MEKILPLFPLNLVVYPQENLNLHIFEPRYKELINDCKAQNLTFGIPSFIENRLMGYGTEVEIIKIEKEYEDGRMDIRTKGLNIFRILTFDTQMKDKLYAGGLVEYIPLENKNDPEITQRLLNLVTELYELLQVSLEVKPHTKKILSFEIAHRLGLSLEQEYELLCISREDLRQEFLLEHLEKTIPIVEEMERTKQLIKMNGHFKNFDPLQF
jgi:Lon protease-like protein